MAFDIGATIEAIAKKHLRLDTLETRNADSLDFHDHAVWQVRDALQAAYDAGADSKKAGESGQPE
ncbi:MAG: hypothetical protein CVV16_14480 [Gammaproteobacteria bacterium HGW-Gammaproteobacteria-6]|jgi:hypothetical protein|nr:MAG: hypothetical protein CVV16_14480 [Gammaproteobacteria bacterium HGW-Gammaproteobacteria-6]